jgi:hypothetical protein
MRKQELIASVEAAQGLLAEADALQAARPRAG